MHKGTFPHEPDAITLPSHSAAAYQRVSAAASVSFKSAGERTRLDRLYQQGNAKIRFPRSLGRSKQAVLINTAGGLTGGDRLDWDVRLGAGARVTATTQACEKIYKSLGDAAHMRTAICVGQRAELHWLPQETILFDRSSLSRTLDVELAADARLIALEAVVLGRHAMGERVDRCSFRERWRIRRCGALVLADDVKLNGRIGRTARGPALLNGYGAFATLAYVGPEDPDRMAAMVDDMRAAATASTIGISAMDNRIVARFLAPDGYTLRRLLAPVIRRLRGEDMPVAWRT